MTKLPFKAMSLSATFLLMCASSAFAEDGAQQTADSKNYQDDLSVFVFAGFGVEGYQSYPFQLTDGDQQLAGISAAWTPIDLPLNFETGLEAGVAIRDDGDRFAQGGTSGEFWLGPTLRHKGIAIGPILVKPAVTVGLSAVTNSNGLEQAREQEFNGNAALLYYIGPEIGLSLKSLPNFDLVYRAHHRSGAARVSYLPSIGNMGDTNNASVFGIRYHF